MPSQSAVLDSVRLLLAQREADRVRFNTIHDYLHGSQPHPASPAGSPTELKRLAQISKVNIMKIVVNSVTQCLYVDGFRKKLQAEDAAVWAVWQQNKMDRSQIGVHRAALAYGVAYATVLPGDSAPEIKGYSPRRMTAMYGDDEDWPMMALLATPSGDKWLYQLFDEESVAFVEGNPGKVSTDGAALTFISQEPHGLGVTPVIRFLNEQDLDEDNEGEVEPLFYLQDQINLTTFELLGAQHYGAFRQRYITGMTTPEENKAISDAAKRIAEEKELVQMGFARILTFEDADVKVGEFDQTNLDGYINSRKESLTHAATLSQTPVHELIGSLVNLSAEALVASEAGQRRKVVERQTSFGESWEMVLELASRINDVPIDAGAQVRWRDTEDRALSATVDALGKMATMLGIPVEMLWERIPGVSQQDIELWKSKAAQGNAMTQLTDMLKGQAMIGAGGTTAAA